MALYEIPLGPSRRTMTITLGAKTYNLRFGFADVEQGGWFMDVSDEAGNAILCGVPLVTGDDILAPYTDLGFGGSLYLVSDGADPDRVPGYDDLGITSHLLWKPDE